VDCIGTHGIEVIMGQVNYVRRAALHGTGKT
jgi:hypothetical protein